MSSAHSSSTDLHERISIDRLRAAQRVLAQYLRPTPLVALRRFGSWDEHAILLKAECLQPAGSFKIRGALFVIAKLEPRERARGVIAYSTGNHARAVALAARAFDIPATVVMSPDAPEAKMKATRELGARIVMADTTSNARRGVAEALSQERGLTLIPPYDHLDIIAGQGTVALELLESGIPRPIVVFVPVGGGGLIAGVAYGLKQIDPTIAVIGVEPEWEDDARRSFHSGQRVALDGPSASMADAVKVQTLGDLTFPLIRQFVDDVVCVEERMIAAAMRLAHDAADLALEPAGALALAAALAHHQPGTNTTLVAIASGGGATPDLKDLLKEFSGSAATVHE